MTETERQEIVEKATEKAEFEEGVTPDKVIIIEDSETAIAHFEQKSCGPDSQPFTLEFSFKAALLTMEEYKTRRKINYT